METRFWRLESIGGHYVPLPVKPLYSPLSGAPLVLHDFRAFRSPDTIGDVNAKRYFYHVDVHMKDLETDWYVTFGVPISREEYELLTKSRYHKRIIIDEVIKFFNDREYDEVVEERLRRWGYW